MNCNTYTRHQSLLTPGQQARAIRNTKEKMIAAHSRAGFSRENFATESVKKIPTNPMVSTNCAVRMEYTFLIKPSLTALSLKLLPIPAYPPSSEPWSTESDLPPNI